MLRPRFLSALGFLSSSRLRITVLVLLACYPAAFWASGAPSIPSFPLPVDPSRSVTARQLASPVLESKHLDSMESPEHWRLFGAGKMHFTKERKHDGQQSLRIISPTKGTQPPGVQGRPFGETAVRREFDNEDWSGFNRVSVWVYPDLPGFKIVSLLLKLQSEGTAGRSYTDGGMHFVLLRNHEWNHVVWEITHLERKSVQGFDLVYRLQGNEPGATELVQFDFDQLELQRVVPTYFQGWNPAAGQISYSHAGYASGARKTALLGGAEPVTFELVDARTAKSVFKGRTQFVQSDSCQAQVADFSEFKRNGRFLLRAGGFESESFPITGNPWRESLVAGLNFFFCERCGYAVENIHGVCHQDWQVEHGGLKLPINGGWHDAGDLSQGLVNTSEAVFSMLRLADSVAKRDPELAARFRAEARWGVEWLLKTRFGDGHRLTWATMDFWTDGKTGNVDDVTVRSGNGAFENFLAAAAEAAAARAYRREDPKFAKRCLNAAIADRGFAAVSMREQSTEVLGASVQALVELYRATEEEEYARDAKSGGALLLQCQATDVPQGWTLPLSGFFYSSPRKERILHYNHRSHEQGVVIALADLCRLFPQAAEAEAWRAAVKRYGDYLLTASQVSAPYRACPAGVYRLADTQDPMQRRQIEAGVKLADGVYLRRFPVWGDFRGNLGVLLSQANAAAAGARLLRSPALRELATEQLEWTLGRNPFCQSLMYGVGCNYSPQYTAMSGDITGSLPVGIQSRLEGDVPYWPTSNCYNYAEVWVHPVSRFFATAAELAP